MWSAVRLVTKSLAAVALSGASEVSIIRGAKLPKLEDQHCFRNLTQKSKTKVQKSKTVAT